MNHDSRTPDEQSSVDTHELLARHRAHDRSALQQIVTRYYSRVERMVRVRMSAFLLARETVADVVQDVFVRVVEGVVGYAPREDARFIDWLARLVQNALVDHVRRGRAHKRGGGALLQQIREHADSATTFAVPADSTGVPSQASQREMSELIDACLGDLSEAHREVILLRDYASADWQMVAEQMGRPSAEACQELHRRARMELAVRLQERMRQRGGEVSA